MARKNPTAELERLDKQYLWHPFTQQTEWAHRRPVIIESAQGVWLKDTQGHRFIDGVSSLWVNVFGHRRKELDQALTRQLKKIAHSTFLGLTHEPAIRLARELVKLAPKPLARVFYSDNGSTAVEVALKMAYQYGQLTGHPKKRQFISLKEGYHGDTLGAVSVGGVDLFHARFESLLFKGWHVTPGDFDEIARVLKKHHAETAAVVMEPLVQGASGMLVMPRGYLAHVAELCRRYNVRLIVDEVATGFGRTGTMFAIEQENVVPDFLCVAKSLTAGYLPLAATLTNEKIYRAFLGRFDEFKAFFHGHTYTANPLACAVALANLELYKKTQLLKKVRASAKQLAVGLQDLVSHSHVKEIRQVGLMVGIELACEKKKAYPPAMRMGLRVCDAALKRGVWLRPLGDVVVLMPPLAIAAKELQFMIRVVKEAIDEATGERRSGGKPVRRQTGGADSR
jgi:adenosylmethionine-8-amino-7-oxononanoate aminotransferase